MVDGSIPQYGTRGYITKWYPTSPVCSRSSAIHLADSLTFFLCRDILWYVFAPLIQSALNDWVKLWNSHRMRKSRYAACPGGVPQNLFDYPYLSGGQNCGQPVDPFVMSIAR